VDVYGIMAKETRTLWENVTSITSCNHGISAYAGCIVISALTGFTGYYQNKPQFNDKYLGIDCEFFFPWKKGGVKVIVKDGLRTIQEIK
jgi:hypothetical protein